MSQALSSLVGLVLLAAALPLSDAAGADRLLPSIAGATVPANAGQRIAVQHEDGLPVAATIVLTGRHGAAFAGHAGPGDGATVAVQSAASPLTIFDGEVSSVEVFDTGGETRVVIRAFDRLHRLTRGRHSRTFEQKTVAEIVSRIAGEHGLIPAASGDVFTPLGVVVQHDQTDLEFLLERAARLGYEVFVEGKTLFFGPRERPEPLTVTPRGPNGDLELDAFYPRLGSSATVQQVLVRGIDARTGAEIVGQAAAPTISLDRRDPDPDGLFGRTVEIAAEVPLASQQEAAAIAKAKLDELQMSYVTGEAVLEGDPRLRPGLLVVIEGANARFDGKYHVTGVSHRYSHADGCGGGYASVLRLRREDGGLFHLPAIDDEVLVSFEHGDLSRPFVVGSLWDSEDDCPKRRPRP